MKSLSCLFLAALLVQGISSCKKNKAEPSGNPLKDKAKTFKVVLANGTVNSESAYSYDGEGRLTKSTGIVGATVEYRYEPGKVFTKTTETNGSIRNDRWDLSVNGGIANQTTPNVYITYLLNDEGYIRKMLITYYNSNGTTYQSDVRDYYYNSMGLLDSIVFYKNSVKEGVSAYAGYTNKPDQFNEQTGRSYTPKQFKNLYTQTILKDANGNITQTNSREFEYDSKGRLIKTIVKRNGVLQNTNTLTYYD
jgi:hypothetical protein